MANAKKRKAERFEVVVELGMVTFNHLHDASFHILINRVSLQKGVDERVMDSLFDSRMTARMVRAANEAAGRNSARRANHGEVWILRKDQNHLDLRVVVTFGIEVVRLDSSALRRTAGITAATVERTRGGGIRLPPSTRLGSFVFGTHNLSEPTFLKPLSQQ